MDADGDIEDREDIEELKQRTRDRMARCVRAMYAAIEREWETCGKASCARSRRCRGLACEPEGDDDA